MEGLSYLFFHTLLFSKSAQQAIHEFIVVMFSVFSASKNMEYISKELAKINKKTDKNKPTEVYLRIFLILILSANNISAIGHFLILYSASSQEICGIQSILLQFGPVLSMWSKAMLLFTKYFVSNNDFASLNIVIPMLIAIISSHIPSASYGITHPQTPNWCWIKGVTPMDFVWRIVAYYGQLLLFTIFTFYVLFTKTGMNKKSIFTMDYYYKLQPEMLFCLGLIFCFFIPSITRIHQFLYPNVELAWITISLTIGCVSFPSVIDVLIYHFYLKCDDIDKTDKPLNTTNNTLSTKTAECNSVITHSTHNTPKTFRFINNFANIDKDIPNDICSIIQDNFTFKPSFLSEFDDEYIDIEYDKDDICDLFELHSLMHQLKNNHFGYETLNDDELASLIFAVHFDILNSYGPATTEHDKLLLCKRFCIVLTKAFNKVCQQRWNMHVDDVEEENLFYEIIDCYQNKPRFDTYSLWRENANIIAERSHGTLMENNFGGQLANKVIKCIRIDWRFELNHDDDDNDNDNDDDIFKVEGDNIIDYNCKNIWMLEPFRFNVRRQRVITHMIGYSQPYSN